MAGRDRRVNASFIFSPSILQQEKTDLIVIVYVIWIFEHSKIVSYFDIRISNLILYRISTPQSCRIGDDQIMVTKA